MSGATEILESIAARVSGLRAACSAEMTLVMAHANAIGDVSNSADATYVYELAAMVLACNRLEEIVQKREAAP